MSRPASGMTVRAVRWVLALSIALSVVIVPAAGIAVAAASSVDTVAAASECCEHSGMPCDNTVKIPHDRSLVCCAATCFVYPGPAAYGIVYAPVATALDPLNDSTAVMSEAARPPFRPPRA